MPRVSAYVGHARGSLTLDTYGHVLHNDSELDCEELRGRLGDYVYELVHEVPP